VEAEGSLKLTGLFGEEPLKIRGRLDRLDRRPDPPALRIVDYKYRHGGEMKSKDRELLQSALRGFSLQPALYALMARSVARGDGPEPFFDRAPVEEIQFRYLAPAWSPNVDYARFASACWETPDGERLRRTVHLLLEGIRTGRFFILPDGYCDFCEYSTACRRFHGPTWLRAYTSEAAKELRRMRKQKATRE
jgi:ATP-dependent helicase/nuclease subunit B